MRVAVLMPVYDDPDALARTLRSVRARAEELGGVRVFVVDDGSSPPVVPARLPTPTAAFAIVLARHAVNLGQGAALETARVLALREPPFDAYVTMDADGQHGIDDMLALTRAIREGADVAFGNRFAGASNVPLARRALLGLARVFENVVTGLSLGDAHNGYRAFSRRALGRLHITLNRMAHATEIRMRVSQDARRSLAQARLRVVEVPVSVRYTSASLSKGQSSLGAVLVLRDLFHRFLFGGPS